MPDSIRLATKMCKLFAALLDGDHIARGLRNRDIREALFGDAKEQQRRHQRRRRPHVQAACTFGQIAGQGATHASLEGDGSWPSPAGHGLATILAVPGRNSCWPGGLSA